MEIPNMQDIKDIFLGYKLFNQKGLTTQISKKVEILSSDIAEAKIINNNTIIIKSEIPLTEETIPIIETLEILQNYNYIEDINMAALGKYMKDFLKKYSDETTFFILRFRAGILGYLYPR